MNIEELYRRLRELALQEYTDIVVDAEVRGDKLRVHLVDDGFLDVWFSRLVEGKYAFHWERRHLDGTVYRWDNAAHQKWRGIKTFPHHFHEGEADNVKPFAPGESVEDTMRIIMDSIRGRIAGGREPEPPRRTHAGNASGRRTG